MSASSGKVSRAGAFVTAIVLVAVSLLSACTGLDEGGMNVVEPPGAPRVSIPGASPWQAGESGDYHYYSGAVGDVDHDAHDCVLNDISTRGFDLQKVEASVWQEDPNGPNWYPMLTLMMMPPANATPDQFMEWVVQVQNVLGILIINQYEELDDDEFDGPLPSVSTWSLSSTGEVGVSLRLPGSYPDPNSAAQALVPWFQNLQVSVRTEADGGEMCDEMGASAAKSR